MSWLQDMNDATTTDEIIQAVRDGIADGVKPFHMTQVIDARVFALPGSNHDIRFAVCMETGL